MSLGNLSVNNNSPQTGERIHLFLTTTCLGGPCREKTLSLYKSADSSIGTDDYIIGSESIIPLENGDELIREFIFTIGKLVSYYGACIENICTNGIRIIPDDDDDDGYEAYKDIDDDNDGLIEISTAQQLNNMRWVTDGSGYRENVTDDISQIGCPENGCRGYELVTDISLADFEGRGWEPVGNTLNPFAAVFEGNGFTIRNLFVHNPQEDFIALFGVASEGAWLRNIHIENSRLTGRHHAGGLIGYANRVVVTNVSLTGNIIGTGERIGGLIGMGVASRIEKSWTEVNVTSAGNSAGGMVGMGISIRIEDSYTISNVNGSGDYIGGLIGHGRETTITNSFAVANVNGRGHKRRWLNRRWGIFKRHCILRKNSAKRNNGYRWLNRRRKKRTNNHILRKRSH